MVLALICVFGIVFVAFDLWRAFDDSEILGRPWPDVRRNSNPPLFWALQGVRGFVLLGFAVIGVALALSQR